MQENEPMCCPINDLLVLLFLGRKHPPLCCCARDYCTTNSALPPGQPLYFGGEEYENIEVTSAMPPPDQESSDLLRDIVLKKGAVAGNASPNLLSPSMQTGQRGRGGRASPSDAAGTPVGGEVSTSTLKSSFFAPKSKSSGGYRYHNGQLLQVKRWISFSSVFNAREFCLQGHLLWCFFHQRKLGN